MSILYVIFLVISVLLITTFFSFFIAKNNLFFIAWITYKKCKVFSCMSNPFGSIQYNYLI